MSFNKSFYWYIGIFGAACIIAIANIVWLKDSYVSVGCMIGGALSLCLMVYEGNGKFEKEFKDSTTITDIDSSTDATIDSPTLQNVPEATG